MRYHFDVMSPRGLARDEEGQELGSEGEAWREAIFAARELASERVLLGERLANWAIVIRTGEQVVRTLPLDDVVHCSEHWFPPGSNSQSGGNPQH